VEEYPGVRRTVRPRTPKIHAAKPPAKRVELRQQPAPAKPPGPHPGEKFGNLTIVGVDHSRPNSPTAILAQCETCKGQVRLSRKDLLNQKADGGCQFGCVQGWRIREGI
jgi:hypothetical protein